MWRRLVRLLPVSRTPFGEHTQLAFYVADIEQTVAELRQLGLTFDEPDMPGLPSRDSEGNLLGVAQMAAHHATSEPGRSTSNA